MEVTCKRCGAQFRLARNPGRARLRCPSCQWYFQLEEPNSAKQFSADGELSQARPDPHFDTRPSLVEPRSIPMQQEAKPKSQFWKWAGFTLLITGLLLVYPITEYRRCRRADQQYAAAITAANSWLANNSLDGFELVYEELSDCIGYTRIGKDETLEELRGQIVDRRNTLYAENKRAAADEAIVNRRWQEAEALLLEYLIEGYGDREEEARARLAEVRQHLDPSLP
ncbi:MAG: hypothetical protein ACI9G1_001033 [Pirellulaceae bacterium]|jgi:hypothetical protein